MKLCLRAISALLLVAFVAAPVAAADQIAAPLERSVFPGVSTITYADQTLVFTTAVPLRIKLSVAPAGHVELRFKAQTARTTGESMTAGDSTGQTIIFWEQAGAEVFNGVASGDWIGLPLTEGGWTEK